MLQRCSVVGVLCVLEFMFEFEIMELYNSIAMSEQVCGYRVYHNVTYTHVTMSHTHM